MNGRTVERTEGVEATSFWCRFDRKERLHLIVAASAFTYHYRWFLDSQRKSEPYARAKGLVTT
jgi:hypothetical protein